jgi:hypothetical protein
LKTLLSIFIFTTAICCSAQSNLDFEKWAINYNGIDEAKCWINTSDASKYDAPPTMFKEVDDPANGLASIKLITAYWQIGAEYGLDTLVGSLMQQHPYAKRPKSFEFEFKADPKFGDAILIGIQLTKTINDTMIVLGEGFFTANQFQEYWIKKEIEIEYYSGYTPDNINIIALSSANAVLSNGSNGYSKVGSTLYLDNLKLNVEEEISVKSGYYIHVFPNPAKEHINIETNSPYNQQVEIYTLTGKLLFKTSFHQRSRIDISTFSSGTYIYKVINIFSQKITATNKFNVVR